jgi:HAD superfamily hydrolase (TIGR01509 family)
MMLQKTQMDKTLALKNNMIQTVIFDMDGVIIDSEPIHFRIEAQLFEELGISVSLEEHYSYVGTSSRNMWKTIVKKNNLIVDIEELTQKNKSLYIQYLAETTNLKPIPGIAALIKELHRENFKLVLASSSSMEVINTVLFKLNLVDFFKTRVSGDELLYSKPDPEIFLKSAKLANSQPKECLVIEDAENGVIAAKVAGMKCIGYSNSGVQNLKGADLIIQSFKEINAAFLKSF